MKALKFIAKITVALAAVAGVVYVIATYGNQLVAWCKKLLASCPCCCNSKNEAPDIVEAEEAAPTEEVAAEEAPAEEAAAEEVPTEEAATVEAEPAQDSDFAN